MIFFDISHKNHISEIEYIITIFGLKFYAYRTKRGDLKK